RNHGPKQRSPAAEPPLALLGPGLRCGPRHHEIAIDIQQVVVRVVGHVLRIMLIIRDRRVRPGCMAAGRREPEPGHRLAVLVGLNAEPLVEPPPAVLAVIVRRPHWDPHPGEGLCGAHTGARLSAPGRRIGHGVGNVLRGPVGRPAQLQDGPSLLLIGYHARVVFPVADRPAVRCDRVPFATGAPPSSIIGPDYPPPTRRIPQLRKWAVDGGIPLRECCPLAYADGLLRGSWVFSPVGSGHLAPRLLVPFPGAPRIGMPREEHRVEAVFASHGLIPEA